MPVCVNVSTPQNVNPHVERLNAYIDECRHAHDWTYEQFALEVGVNVATVHAIRKGTNVPFDHTARKFDRVLGFQEGKGVRYILDGRKPLKKPKRQPKPEDETDKAIRLIREKKHLKNFQKQVLIDILEQTRQRVLEQAEEMDQQAYRDSDTA